MNIHFIMCFLSTSRLFREVDQMIICHMIDIQMDKKNKLTEENKNKYYEFTLKNHLDEILKFTPSNIKMLIKTQFVENIHEMKNMFLMQYSSYLRKKITKYRTFCKNTKFQASCTCICEILNDQKLQKSYNYGSRGYEKIDKIFIQSKYDFIHMLVSQIKVKIVEEDISFSDIVNIFCVIRFYVSPSKTAKIIKKVKNKMLKKNTEIKSFDISSVENKCDLRNEQAFNIIIIYECSFLLKNICYGLIPTIFVYNKDFGQKIAILILIIDHIIKTVYDVDKNVSLFFNFKVNECDEKGSIYADSDVKQFKREKLNLFTAFLEKYCRNKMQNNENVTEILEKIKKEINELNTKESQLFKETYEKAEVPDSYCIRQDKKSLINKK